MEVLFFLYQEIKKQEIPKRSISQRWSWGFWFIWLHLSASNSVNGQAWSSIHKGALYPACMTPLNTPQSSQLAGSYRAETLRSRRRRIQEKKCPFWKKGHQEWRFTVSQNPLLPRLPPAAGSQVAAPAWADASVLCSSAGVPSCSLSARCCQWSASTPQTAAPQYRRWTLHRRRRERSLYGCSIQQANQLLIEFDRRIHQLTAAYCSIEHVESVTNKLAFICQ